MKLDGNGNKIWDKVLTESNYMYGAHAITTTSDGNFVVAGSGSNNTYVMKLDSNGNKIWSKIFIGDDYCSASAITTTSDGGFAVTGFDGRIEMDSYVMKLDSNGNKIWSKIFTGDNYQEYIINAITTTSDGDFVIAGEKFPAFFVMKLK